MDLRDDERGQAVQVGVVLLLAVLVVAISFYQASVVPDQNREVEFNHYLDAGSDVADLRNAILRSAASGEVTAQKVTVGTVYPERAIFVNPPPATGRLSTGPTGNAALGNVTASAGAPSNVRAFWAGSSARTYRTTPVTFRPEYSYIGAPAVATAYGYTYRNYSSPVELSAQTLVRGNRITLVATRGNLSASGRSATVTVDPLSAHARTISVTNNSSGPVTLTVPTALSAAKWNRTLSGQYDPNGSHPDRYVRDVRPAPGDAVTVELEPNETYELRLAMVGLSAGGDELVVESPAASYLTAVTDRVVQTGVGTPRRIVVEARDRYNNPVSGSNVTFEADGGQFESSDGTSLGTLTTVQTDDQGRATVWFNGSASDLYHVTAYNGSTADSTLPDEQTVNFDVAVRPGANGQVILMNYLDEYDDGKSGSNTSIPPASPLGAFGSFDQIKFTDMNPATLDEEKNTNNNYEARVGVVARNVRSSVDYQVAFRYEMSDAEDLSAQLVDADGNAIGPSWNLPASTDSSALQTFSMTEVQADYVREHNSVYLVLTDETPDGTRTTYTIYYVEIAGS